MPHIGILPEPAGATGSTKDRGDRFIARYAVNLGRGMMSLKDIIKEITEPYVSHTVY